MVSVFIDAELAQVEAAQRIGAAVCEVHTGPYAHVFHSQGRDAESVGVVSELAKLRGAGNAIRELGMRFNAGHALTYFNVEPVAQLPGVRELHIGHAIVSRAVFIGMREAVREMKALMVQSSPRLTACRPDLSLRSIPCPCPRRKLSARSCSTSRVSRSPTRIACASCIRSAAVSSSSRATISHRQQVTALTAEMHSLRSPALLIAVDHEGGRVQRFRDGFTPIPPMRALGRPVRRASAIRRRGWRRAWAS